jgi:hypothetical protein
MNTKNSDISYPVLPPSSGNTRLAAYNAGTENSAKLAQLGTVGGGGNIPAPSVPLSYNEHGTGSNIGGTINDLAKIQLQSGANRVYDTPTTQVKSGGTRHKKTKRRKMTYKKRKGYFKPKTLRSTLFRRKRRNKTKK